MLAGEFSSRWIGTQIPYMCIIARASTNRMILFAFRFDCSRRLRYDMVLLIDLFGSAFDLPSNICANCYDINQDIARYYNVGLQTAFDKSREQILWEQRKENAVLGDKHNALYDAKVIRELYQILNKVNFDKKYAIN